VFLGDAWNFPSEIRFTLTLTTTALLPNAYPVDRENLVDRVITMRDEQRLQYKEIADALVKKGATGARGAQLEAKNVFALYKRRKAYLAKRSAPIQFAITNMIVYPATLKKAKNSHN
jgi:hypothetical protein